eukprot:3947383-Alexandrium_andersonii.AAC.1
MPFPKGHRRATGHQPRQHSEGQQPTQQRPAGGDATPAAPNGQGQGRNPGKRIDRHGAQQGQWEGALRVAQRSNGRQLGTYSPQRHH